MIQENGESQFKKDIISFFLQLISSYTKEKNLLDINSVSRIMVSLVGPSKTIPLMNGKLALAEHQRVFLCEFSQSHTEREIIITYFRN
jgi:secondary thiamine-phosphate synthase enzyme